MQGSAPPSAAPRQPAAQRPSQPPWHAPTLLVATCGWLGRASFAPGTWGAAAGLPLAVLTGWTAAAAAERFADGSDATRLAVEAAVVVAFCLAGIPLCSQAAAVLGRGKDPSAVVYDEFAAMPLTLLVVPPPARAPLVLAAGFVLFRIFDIWKPFPCRRLERLPAGLGIMADDWAAAAWAAGVLAVASRWL
jgi:phosphatidylglycerophosphatase A